MLVKFYWIWSCIILGLFTGLAVAGVKLPRTTGVGTGVGGSRSYFGSSHGGWGFGK